MTALNRNSKPDTVFLGIEAEAGIESDLSEQRIDLVVASGVATEANSTRAALTYPRELLVIVDLAAGDDGVILFHGDATGSPYNYRMNLTFAGALECSENGALRASVAIPGLAAIVPRRVLLHWSSRIAGTSVHSEVFIHNFTTGESNIAIVQHSAGSDVGHADLIIGGEPGAAFTAGLDRFVAARISRRFHTTTEAREDWIEESTPPSVTGIRRRSALEFDRQDIDLGEDGEFAGPAYLWAGASARDNDRRCISPLVNLRILDPIAIVANGAPFNETTPSPIDPDFSCSLAHVFYRPCNSNRAHVRIFVRQSLADLTDDHAGPVTYQMLSTHIPPTLGNAANLVQNTNASAAVTCNNIHAIGVGEWLDLGVLPLQVDAWGFTWLLLSWKFGDDDVALDTRANITAITIDPFTEPDANTLDKTI